MALGEWWDTCGDFDDFAVIFTNERWPAMPDLQRANYVACELCEASQSQAVVGKLPFADCSQCDFYRIISLPILR